MVEKQKAKDAPDKRLGPFEVGQILTLRFSKNIQKHPKATPQGTLEGYVGSRGGCRLGPRGTPWGPPGGRSGDLVADVHDNKCTLDQATPKTAEILFC